MSSYRSNTVAKDRNIFSFPQAFILDKTPYTMIDFHPKVKSICSPTTAAKMAKVVLIGDTGVGKSCLCQRFCHEVFERDYKATIGVDFEVELFQVLKVPFKVQIWDTAGQERFKSVAAAYYRSGHAVLVVFDLTSLESLRNAEKWKIDSCKQIEIDNPYVFLIGTKRDLVSDSAYRDMEKLALELAAKIGAEYWAVSSKTGEQVKEFFFRVTALVFDAQVLREISSNSEKPKTQIGNDVGISSRQVSQFQTQVKMLSLMKSMDQKTYQEYRNIAFLEERLNRLKNND